MYNFPEVMCRLSELFDAASGLGVARCGVLVNGRPVFEEYAEQYRGIGAVVRGEGGSGCRRCSGGFLDGAGGRAGGV